MSRPQTNRHPKEKKHKKQPVKKPFWFLQGTGTYGGNVLVCVGHDKEGLVAVLKKMHKGDGFIAALEDFKMGEDVNGAVIKHGNRRLMWLKPFEDDWKWYETLLHETAHLVHQVLGQEKGMMDEDEARAYQHVFLFREIRMAVQKKYGLLK